MKYKKNFVQISYGKKGNIENDIFIFKTEVTNKQFQLFLKSIKDSVQLKSFSPQNENWKLNPFSNELWAEYYYPHPAFDNYPVVNITKQSADAFCNWYSNKLNMEHSNLHFEIMLPTKEEWEKVYMKTKGEIEQIIIQIDENNLPIEPLQPTATLIPNSLKIYGMNHNVSELTSDGFVCGKNFTQNEKHYVLPYSEPYSNSSPTVGFRPIMKISKSQQHGKH